MKVISHAAMPMFTRQSFTSAVIIQRIQKVFKWLESLSGETTISSDFLAAESGGATTNIRISNLIQLSDLGKTMFDTFWQFLEFSQVVAARCTSSFHTVSTEQLF